jgi:formate hydrogenlyase subunit 6/NADH:ubiquinone oxidoreductase subunit I
MAEQHGVTETRYGLDGAHHQHAPIDDSNPYFQFNPAACIVCSRCVRACDEIQGTFALTIAGRGFASQVSASNNQSFLESECVSCGQCIEACPPRALTITNAFELAGPTREGLIFEKQDLLAPMAEGMLAAPHPMVEGTTDTEYYRGEVIGPTAAQVDWVAGLRPEDPTLDAARARAAATSAPTGTAGQEAR